MRWIVACVALLALALLWERWRGAPEPSSEVELRTGQAPPPDSAAALESAQAARGERSAEAAEPAAAPSPPPGDLLELLRRIAQAYVAQDARALGTALEELLRTPARCEEALLLLEHGGLREDDLARNGAVFGLGAALSFYAAPSSPIAVDARAFTVRVLEGLAEVLPPEQLDLADQLIQARAGERYVLDLSYLGKILELRGRHPELAELYSSLLVHMAESLSDERGLEEFRALFLNSGQDPTALQLSLAALLRTDAASWLPLAEDAFAEARGNPALRSAIATAIATAAPVQQAAGSLARLADSNMYDEFALLGGREGGSEALAARYSELVGEGGNALARRMLVSGLRTEQESVLVGIARTDPDPLVRTQALLTSSLARASGPELLDQLESLYDLRSDPAQGISSAQALMVAGNVLANSPGAERDRARELLLRIAGDSGEKDSDRLQAIRSLKPWMPPGTFDDWVIGGKAVK
jgi:hypothetical protein